jgi:hypothetical protein
MELHMKRLVIVADDAFAARVVAQPQNRRGRRGTRAMSQLDRTWAVRVLSRVPYRQGLDGGRARRAGPTSISVRRCGEVIG